MILAGLDLGTNTFRLLVARMASDRRWEELYSDQRITRLGEGLGTNGRLQPEPIRRAINTLKEYHDIITKYSVEKIVAVATSAVREAANGAEFVKAVQDETSIEVEVISPEEEARRTLLGVLSGFERPPKSFLVVDIGGGSTEFMWGNLQRLMGFLSTDLGVVRLTERFLSDPRPTRQQMDSLTEYIVGWLDQVKRRIQDPSRSAFLPARFVGTAGTVTTLAAIDLGLKVYDPQRIHLHRLEMKTVERILEELMARTPQERLSIPGMQKGREDLILPGALILLLTMRTLKLSEVTVSEYGLREGILVDYYKKHEVAGMKHENP